MLRCLVSEWNIFYRALLNDEALKASHNNRASIRVPSHRMPLSGVTMRKGFKALTLPLAKVGSFSKLQLMTRGCTLCD